MRIFAGLDKPHFAMFRTNSEGFIAETKDTMDSMNLKPIEQAKIKFARKLFNSLPTSRVRYHDVDSYENLLAVMETL